MIRSTSSYRSSDGLAPVLRVAIESGIIYTMTMSAGLVFFLLRSRLVYVVMDIVCIVAPAFPRPPLIDPCLRFSSPFPAFQSSPTISIVMNMIVVRVGLAIERKKRCGSGHSRSISRPLGAGGDIETMGFVAITVPVPIPRPSPSYMRPESETALRYSVNLFRADRDEGEVGSVAFKLARLALQGDDPLTPDDHEHRRESARDSGYGEAGFGLGEEDEEEVKSVSDLALDSARGSSFHIVTSASLLERASSHI